MTEETFGISVETLCRIEEEVTIIIHATANISFRALLLRVVLDNCLPALQLGAVAMKMTRLQHFVRQSEKNKQCIDKAESHRASLVLKDEELRDAISELARRDEGLDLTIEALRTNQLRLIESASKVNEYLDLLETIQYRSLEAEFTNAQSEAEPVNSPILWEILDPLIQQSEQLVGHLKQADRDAQDALDMAVRVATGMHSVTKRKRISEGESESENNSGSSPSADTMKRARLSDSRDDVTST